MPVVEPVRTPSGQSSHPLLPRLSMPPEMVNEAATRLCWISNLFAITTVAITLAQGALQPEAYEMLQRPLIRLSGLFTLFLTVGFVIAHRFAWFSKYTLIKLGVLFEVAVAFYIGLNETSIRFDPDDVVRGSSLVALWIIITGLMIPNTPLMKLISGILSASMWPLAYYVNLYTQNHPPLPWNRLSIWMVPILVAVVWSYLLNRRVYGMQVDKQKAKDLGSYQLDYLIGRGGMGEVWRAKHRMLQRDAAIKIIRPEVLATLGGRQASTLRRRFEKEARSTAMLRSPHTVALYDFGASRDGSFFYVMELLDGIDLQTLVERFGPQPAGRVAQILLQVCDSLEEAHRLGLIHRDIKPTNLLLCRLGQMYDFTKVLDFGLVKNIFPTGNPTLMSMDGQATGTPAYMAPEIALGQHGIDQRADIYGLGCVAYFLVTGQLVFNESTPTALALAHVQKPPVPPSQRVEMPVPPDLERVILDCLEKDPAKRPHSAQELARRIEAAAGIEPWHRADAYRWWRTNLPEEQVPAARIEESTPVTERSLAGAAIP
ncbi:MAG TPA: serine/threonine-protein kinase [Bryobacteraceae bacterium]|nr:serine/threonine-protein kinase [Bryobacteraceae bacterium]